MKAGVMVYSIDGLPGGRASGDITDMMCHDAADAMFGEVERGRLADVSRFAMHVASLRADGVGADDALSSCRRGVERAALARSGSGLAVLTDAFDVLGRMASVVADVYSRPTATGDSVRRHRRELAYALLAGNPERTFLARSRGIDLAPYYRVVVLDLEGPFTDAGQTLSDAVEDAVTDAGAARAGVLTLAFESRAVLLLPREHADAADAADAVAAGDVLDGIVRRIALATGATPRGAAVDGAVSDLTATFETADDLLALARALRWPTSGGGASVVGIADLALEYQLTRPGPGRACLDEYIRLVDEHDFLLDTVVVYSDVEHGRRLAAERLFVHPNTIDYRLQKASKLLGFDVTSTMGHIVLAAMSVIVHSSEHAVLDPV